MPVLTASAAFPAWTKVKAAVGFGPTNNGFANRPLRPLGYAAITIRILSKNLLFYNRIL